MSKRKIPPPAPEPIQRPDREERGLEGVQDYLVPQQGRSEPRRVTAESLDDLAEFGIPRHTLDDAFPKAAASFWELHTKRLSTPAPRDQDANLREIAEAAERLRAALEDASAENELAVRLALGEPSATDHWSRPGDAWRMLENITERFSGAALRARGTNLAGRPVELEYRQLMDDALGIWLSAGLDPRRKGDASALKFVCKVFRLAGVDVRNKGGAKTDNQLRDLKNARLKSRGM